MAESHRQHAGTHAHEHGPNCGHTAIAHNGHTYYLHDGHLHHAHGDHVDDHQIEVSRTNPENCTPDHNCGAHQKNHVHGAGCGHQAVPHGNHVDYLVDGHLHHPCEGHCDDHGALEVAGTSRAR